MPEQSAFGRDYRHLWGAIGAIKRLRLVYERLVYEELDSVYLQAFVTWESQSEALPGLAQVVEVRTHKGHMVHTAIRRWVILLSCPARFGQFDKTGVLRGDGYSMMSTSCLQTSEKPQVLIFASFARPVPVDLA